jgi:putative nucleotidyltransferase with HDIG domain
MGPYPRIPAALDEIAAVYERAGFECMLVGGAIRDFFLGKTASDWDIATNAPPAETMRIFRGVIPTGIKHGTVTIRRAGQSFETTTYRTEHGYSDGRRPDRIEFASSIVEDLSRRDFTMNAIAFDHEKRVFIDPFGGRADIQARIIRAIGCPRERFEEDGLRPMRAARFAAQLGFRIDEPTLEAMGESLARFGTVAFERVRDEFSKILLSDDPARGIALLRDTGMLERALPELSSCFGVEQGGMHRFDVFGHSLRACAASPRALVPRLAALLHDIGKPRVRNRSPGADRFAFHRHESEGAEMAEIALKRLRYPNDVVDRVRRLVLHHMFAYDESWTDAAVRRFVARVGIDLVDDLFALRRADGRAIADRDTDPRPLAEFAGRIDAVIAAGNALGIKDLAIGGDELRALGYSPGPSMGKALSFLLEAVMDDPGLNTKEALERMAAAFKVKTG